MIYCDFKTVEKTLFSKFKTLNWISQEQKYILIKSRRVQYSLKYLTSMFHIFQSPDFWSLI